MCALKYLSLKQIKESLVILGPHHPVFAVTFFVMKQANAPIGRKERIQLDALNDAFLKEHYRVHPKSSYFFRVMRQGTPKRKQWNDPKYAAKGLQSVNTRGCADAFLHDRGDNTWGWSPEYVLALTRKLTHGNKVPLFHTAVWLYRDNAWPDETNRSDIIKRIISDYAITKEELEHLFDTDVASDLPEKDGFQSAPAKWHEILSGVPPPDDVPPESSGVLTYLEMELIGPVQHLRIEPSRRLNIITGDNGLGKTFLLDLAWWALTRDWADRPPWPSVPARRGASIKFAVSATGQSGVQKAKWNPTTGEWRVQERTPAISGLVIYARVDGSFAVWDPVNRILQQPTERSPWPGLKFTREQVWNGTSRIEGLIRDWVKWQERQDKYPAFATFAAVLKRVSPPDLGPLVAGDPERIPGEIRDIPTLVYPYGTVPIVFASAGIKRILTLAYLIVWAWEEHKLHAKQAGKREERQMVVIIDEVEAHLHPRWQRVILPALMGIAVDLNPELSMQLLVATHSPLVLASSEPVFDDEYDRLFHLEMMSNGRIEMAEVPFDLRGSVDSWLASDVFRIAQPGSPQRESAIASAISLQQQKNPTRDAIQEVTDKLREYLPPEDQFWARWVFFAEEHGVTL